MLCENVKQIVFSRTAEVMEQGTGTVAFRGLCDVTLSLSLNLVPVREDYTPDHAHTPNGAAVRHCSLLSHTCTVRMLERGEV